MFPAVLLKDTKVQPVHKQPFSHHSLSGIIFLHPTLSSLFHTLFSAENPLTAPPTAHFSHCSLSAIVPFQCQQVFLQGCRNRRGNICSTLLLALGYVGAVLTAMLNIWIKKLLCDWFVFSLIHPICNMKSSISLWKVLNLFLPFILISFCIIYRLWFSMINYFLSTLPKQRFAKPFTNHIYWGKKEVSFTLCLTCGQNVGFAWLPNLYKLINLSVNHFQEVPSQQKGISECQTFLGNMSVSFCTTYFTARIDEH